MIRYGEFNKWTNLLFIPNRNKLSAMNFATKFFPEPVQPWKLITRALTFLVTSLVTTCWPNTLAARLSFRRGRLGEYQGARQHSPVTVAMCHTGPDTGPEITECGLRNQEKQQQKGLLGCLSSINNLIPHKQLTVPVVQRSILSWSVDAMLRREGVQWI